MQHSEVENLPADQLEELFCALGRSKFRSRFQLHGRELVYLQSRGLNQVLSHAETFIRERLAMAKPAHDGKQTPMRGHPAFVAQHATGTCCRSCLAKWHKIPQGGQLDESHIAYILAVLEHWIQQQLTRMTNQDNPANGENLREIQGNLF